MMKRHKLALAALLAAGPGAVVHAQSATIVTVALGDDPWAAEIDAAAPSRYPGMRRGDGVMANTLIVKVGDKTFTATLLDSPTAKAFGALLPLSLSMEELNGNEKFATLPVSLPTRAVRPSPIRTGDLMLYGSNTLVLFYESFSTTYSYTPIGRIDDPAGLEAALGSGDVAVTFEAKQGK